MEIYVVKSGDTVNAVARTFGVTTEAIIFVNQLVPPYTLVIGQALLILNQESEMSSVPGGPPDALMPLSPDTAVSLPLPVSALPPLVSFGYAYTYISRWVLQQTLPYLSDLYIFSYGFTPQGTLISPPLDDTWMIEAARGAGVRPILTLTPFGTDGKFNNSLISSVVNTPAYKETLIQQLYETLQTKGYQGVDVDFEFILADDRDAFTDFVVDLGAALRPSGYQVSVALAPKTSATQPGLLYEGKDYAALGAAADTVLLMTYEWGYAYGPNMAVAPINQVRRVVEYAVTEIPPEKINLGIPNYGYDWPLPFVRNQTMATTIGNVQAVQIALQTGASIQFDELAQSPFFRYRSPDGIMHEVWFEDVRSIQAKFNLMKEFSLRGAGYWQLMRWWRANWLLMEQTFTIQ